MGNVHILPETTKEPISMIGKMAGICWGADTEDYFKNFNRGLKCLKSEHGRTYEFPDVYMRISGYSARVIREWYTHIGGSPTRLQASTRYIDYDNFEYVTPQSIQNNEDALRVYKYCMDRISSCLKYLTEENEIPREDAALLLPLGMTTDIVVKHNARNLIDMSRQRMCNRAYHEYRELFRDVKDALAEYSPEWETLVDMMFYAKCEKDHVCREQNGCGKYPSKEEKKHEE